MSYNQGANDPNGLSAGSANSRNRLQHSQEALGAAAVGEDAVGGRAE